MEQEPARKNREKPEFFDSVALVIRKKDEHNTLSGEEVNLLAEYKFKRFTKENPFDGGGEFSPEDELKKIKTLPKEKKPDALIEFKQKLAIQRHALGECRRLIEEAIEEKNDVSEECLLGIVKKFSECYGFSFSQNQTIFFLIGLFLEKRENASELYSQYSDKLELVRVLSGLDDLPEPLFLDVSKGPFGIDIIADPLTSNRIYKNNSHLDDPINIDGFANPYGKVFYTVLVKKEGPFGIRSEGYIHEKEHLKNSLFKNFFYREASFFDIHPELVIYNNPNETRERKKVVLEKYFSNVEKTSEVYARDEILAMRKGGERGSIQYNFIRSNGKKPSYDYFSVLYDFYVKNLGYDFKTEGNTDDSLWNEVETMFLDKYEKVVKEGVLAFKSLQEEYPLDEVIALLTDKPLSSWKKTAERILDFRSKQNQTEDMLQWNKIHSSLEKEGKNNFVASGEYLNDSLDKEKILNFYYDKNYLGLFLSMRYAREKKDIELADFIVKTLGKEEIRYAILRASANFPMDVYHRISATLAGNSYPEPYEDIKDFLEGNILGKE